MKPHNLTPLRINEKGTLENIIGESVNAHPHHFGLKIVPTTDKATCYEFQQAILKAYGFILDGTKSKYVSVDYIASKYAYVEGTKEKVAMNGESSNICYVPVQIYVLEE